MNQTSPPRDGGKSARLAHLCGGDLAEQLRTKPLRHELLDVFRTGSPAEKAQLAGSLRNLAPRYWKRLREGLSHPEPEARAAVAEVLARIGDPGAIPPLAQALKESLGGRSPAGQMFIGVLYILSIPVVAVVSLLFLVALAIPFQSFPFEGLKFSCYGYPKLLLTARARRSRARAAIAAALAELIERNPTPEALPVLADLKVLSNDVIQQDSASRVRSEDAKRRVEAVVESLLRLPLAAAKPTESAGPFPTPASPPAGQNRALPAPAGPPVT